MEAQWVAQRQCLRNLLATCPNWSQQDLADAVGRSIAWVKKWSKRLRDAPVNDETVFHSRSRARKTPPPSLSPLVVNHILALRDHPPHNLNRIPGPKAILYYLYQDASLLHGLRLPRSTHTIWRILRQHQRIVDPPFRNHQPLPRPEPLCSWQLDFKDASTVPPEGDGKRQHVVEVLNTVDVGTSILLTAQPRADFTMATAIEAVAQTVQAYGVPQQVTFDRDQRFVGTNTQRDCPSPFLRFWLCLGVQVIVCPPRRPDINGFVERYHRSYEEECLQVYRPADLQTVKTVTAAFQQHYNYERPHQGEACENQPPRVAFASLPSRPALPHVIDPDHWIDVWDGKYFVRKVQRDTSISVDERRYYLTKQVVGQLVNVRIEASTRSFVLEHEGAILKRIAIGGTGKGAMSFEDFVHHVCAEARDGRTAVPKLVSQLSVSLN